MFYVIVTIRPTFNSQPLSMSDVSIACCQIVLLYKVCWQFAVSSGVAVYQYLASQIQYFISVLTSIFFSVI